MAAARVADCRSWRPFRSEGLFREQPDLSCSNMNMQSVPAGTFAVEGAEQSGLGSLECRSIDVAGENGCIHSLIVFRTPYVYFQLSGVGFDVFIADDAINYQPAGAQPYIQVYVPWDLDGGGKVLRALHTHQR